MITRRVWRREVGLLENVSGVFMMPPGDGVGRHAEARPVKAIFHSASAHSDKSREGCRSRVRRYHHALPRRLFAGEAHGTQRGIGGSVEARVEKPRWHLWRARAQAEPFRGDAQAYVFA